MVGIEGDGGNNFLLKKADTNI